MVVVDVVNTDGVQMYGEELTEPFAVTGAILAAVSCRWQILVVRYGKSFRLRPTVDSRHFLALLGLLQWQRQPPPLFLLTQLQDTSAYQPPP